MKKILLILLLLPCCVSKKTFVHYKKMNEIEHNLMNADIKCNRYKMQGIRRLFLENNKFKEASEKTAKKTNEQLIEDIIDILSIDMRKILRPFFDLNLKKTKD